MTWFVYVLKLNNWKYYLWSTNNLKRRIYEHKSWAVRSTRKYIPCDLIFFKEYWTPYEARHVESKIKSHKKQQSIIDFINWSLVT